MAKILSQNVNAKITVLPNFVPRPPRQIKSTGYQNYFLFGGVLRKNKGIVMLLDAMKSCASDIGARLIITGEGPLKEYVMDFIHRNQLHDKILYLGWVAKSTLYSLMRNANALVLPSVWPENNPLIALEALSVGLPVISSDAGGLPEIVGKLSENLIFKAGDIGRLSKIMLDFDRKRYRMNDVVGIYESNYSPEHYVGKYLNLTRGL
jgi:glycosyltransferase involved in cell wall biosynthesis